MAKSKTTQRPKAKPLEPTTDLAATNVLLVKIIERLERNEQHLEGIEHQLYLANAGTPSQHGRG